MKKIAILANRNNHYDNKIEERADEALENLGYTVLPFHEKEENVLANILNSEADTLIFYKAGIESGNIGIEEFKDFLKRFKGEKICLYWDKVYSGRQNFIHQIAPLTDLIFLTDGDFLNAHNYLNIYKMPPVTDVKKPKGKIKKKFQIPIVFPGQSYGDRGAFINQLKERYGDDFQQIFGVWDQDFTDLCASAKVFVSPLYPQTDLYWSDRVYKVLGRGGFLIMPKLEGLTWELTEGEHLEFYRNPKELFEKIDYYLENEEERDRIRKAGQKYCLKHYTFEKSFKKMLKIL